MAPLQEPWHGLSVYGAVTRHVADTALFLDATGDGEPLAPAVGRDPGQAPDRHLDARHRRRSSPRRTTSSRARSTTCASCCAASATTSAAPRSPTAPPRIAFTARYFARRRRRGGQAAPSRAALAPHQGLPPPRQRDPERRAGARPRRGGRQRARDRHRLRARRRPDDADVHQAPDPDRHLRGPRRAVVVQRLLALGAVLRAVQPHRPARRVGAGGLHRRRLPARRPARRPPRRRGDAASRSPPRSRPRGRGRTASRRFDRARRGDRPRGRRAAARGVRDRAADRDEEQPDRPRLRGRRRRREADPRAPAGRPAGRRDARRGGLGHARQQRAALDRRPARRHHELPVRHPAVGRLDRGRGRAGHARRRRLRPDARRAVGRRARRARRRSTASRSTAASTRTSSPQALVATGYGYEADVRAAQAEISGRLLPLVRDIRRMGSAAIDLAWTAAGRYDAYFERGIKTWDLRRRRADLRGGRARGEAPESGASHGRGDPRRAAPRSRTSSPRWSTDPRPSWVSAEA